jgi:hypothetical protein
MGLPSRTLEAPSRQEHEQRVMTSMQNVLMK